MDSKAIEKFIHDGWIILDIPQQKIIKEFADMLEQKAQEVLGTDCKLSNIHQHTNDEEFDNLYIKLSEYFWENEFSLSASSSFLEILKDLIGLDLMVQYMPFLRLARPHNSKDNIGYHRDTQYGQTPYELAVHIPFVDLDDQSALQVISGSHFLPESAFPSIDGLKTDVKKGSTGHMLGKPYDPKQLNLPDEAKTVPLSMHVGQAAIFSPAIFHGQKENTGNVTRVTTDLRFVNSHANVPLKKGKVRAGYVPILQSPIEKMAAGYYQAQKNDESHKKMA